jgi:hypothetical protein
MYSESLEKDENSTDEKTDINHETHESHEKKKGEYVMKIDTSKRNFY